MSQCLPISLVARHLLGALVRAQSASRVEGAHVSWTQGSDIRAGGSEAWGGGHPSFQAVLCHTNLERGVGPGNSDQGPCLIEAENPCAPCVGDTALPGWAGKGEVPMGMSRFELSNLRVE